MDIKKCDFCKKEIKEAVVAGTGFFSGVHVELCDECGKTILRFLQKHKIIDKNKKAIKKS